MNCGYDSSASTTNCSDPPDSCLHILIPSSITDNAEKIKFCKSFYVIDEY